MKIKIITIHNIPNFGSIFQCLALCEYLKKIGYRDIEVIDYNPNYFKTKTLRSQIGKIINYKYYKNRTRKFNDFVKTFIPLTSKSFSTIEELEKNDKNDKNVDLYIVGGDQLWNIYHDCGKDDAYKLTWTNKKKISYGTSLGQTNFTTAQLQELANKIADYEYIAVRESSSISMLEKVGIKAFHTVDPVFLLNEDFYNRFLMPINQSGYLLVYLVTPSVLLERCIEFLTKKYNLKVILCSGFSKKCTCDVFLKDLGPNEILSYIKNADMILSSSFHATSFSLIFKKQFFTILPDINTNERIEDLLRNRKLYDRIITNETKIEEELSKIINYDMIKDYNNIISSKEYIEKAVKNV